MSEDTGEIMVEITATALEVSGIALAKEVTTIWMCRLS